jgi:hypothetical protein
MDVVVVKPFNKIWLPVFGIGLFLGIIPKLPFVDCHKAKQVELQFADTPFFHFDGEPGKLKFRQKLVLIVKNCLLLLEEIKETITKFKLPLQGEIHHFLFVLLKPVYPILI